MTFGAESVMAPPGLWGMKGSSLPAFGEKRRKTEVSTPLLYTRAERAIMRDVWYSERVADFRFLSAIKANLSAA